MADKTTKDLQDEVTLLLKTRHPLVRVETPDEGFVAELITRAARSLGLPVYVWNIADGLKATDPPARKPVDRTGALVGALNYLREARPEAVCIVQGAHPFLRDAIVARLLRHHAEQGPTRATAIFLVDGDGDVPAELASVVVPHPLGLPSGAELREFVHRTIEELRALRPSLQVNLSPEEAKRLLDQLRGLSRAEVRQLLARVSLDDDKLTAEDIPRVVAEKRARLTDTGVVEFVPVDDRPEAGGLRGLQQWLDLRRAALGAEARAFGLDVPRGVLLLGVQGCGKSLLAKVTAHAWSLPLLRLDMGRLYDRYVGESERHLRRALSVAEAMAPCVLWIDEIEKAFAGASGGSADGGVTQRMFGTLLTWLQDHKDLVFTVGTANDIAALPPELLRKGRFDELFFVDLPDAAARAQIVGIHLKRRKRDPALFDLGAVAAAAEGFSGAELEQLVVAALYRAYGEKRELTTEDLRAEAARTRPSGVVAAERINALRAWARARCVPAQ